MFIQVKGCGHDIDAALQDGFILAKENCIDKLGECRFKWQLLDLKGYYESTKNKETYKSEITTYVEVELLIEDLTR